MPRKSLLWLFSLLVCVACGESVMEPKQQAAVDFEYGVTRLPSEPPFVITREDDSLLVRGWLSTPCAPYDASSNANVQGNTLVVRIVGRATGECPLDVVAPVGYQAIVSVPATSFSRLIVVHEWRDVNWPNETPLDLVLSN